MMHFLALVLLGPWLFILAWAYWRYPESLPRTPARRSFDSFVVLSAAVVAVVLTHYGFTTAASVLHPGRIGVWQMIAPVLYAYAGFSAALALGLLARMLVWRRSDAAQSN